MAKTGELKKAYERYLELQRVDLEYCRKLLDELAGRLARKGVREVTRLPPGRAVL